MRKLNLWDEVFCGVTVVEAINQKDLVKAVAWLSHNSKIVLSDDALDLLKLKEGWRTWAKAIKPAKQFSRA